MSSNCHSREIQTCNRYSFFKKKQKHSNFHSIDLLSFSGGLSIETRRTLILISKLLQNLSNRIQFDGSKEEYMVSMNPFIEQNYAVVEEIFKSLVVCFLFIILNYYQIDLIDWLMDGWI